MSLLLSLLLAIILPHASAAPLAIQDFHLHDFDAGISHALGYERAAIIYMSEMASVTEEEAKMRGEHEAVGCYPFYVLKEGSVQEAGYNCGTFFCVGYFQGPKQCRTRDGNSYGGTVEINRRLGLLTAPEVHVPFASFPEADQTPAMRERVKELSAFQCIPFYLLRFDLVVGEGFDCEELDASSLFSARNTCVDDWRNDNGMQCDIPYREDEMTTRQEALSILALRQQSAASVSSYSSVSMVLSATGSVTESADGTPFFPDIVPGKYGYTAITALAQAGVLRGYPDGTFQPEREINRAEFATLLVRRYAKEMPQGSSCFPDVRSQWFAPAVCSAKDLGWVKGYRDGRFRPHAPLTRAEAMKMLTAALGLPLTGSGSLPPDVARTAWYASSVRAAQEHGLLLEPVFLPSLTATRADMAVWLYRSMKIAESGSGATVSMK